MLRSATAPNAARAAERDSLYTMPSAPLKTTLAGGPGKNALLDPAKKQYGERGAIAYLRTS